MFEICEKGHGTMHKDIMESFEYVTYHLVVAFLDPSLDMEKQMHHFPLQPGESWFPAIDNPNQIFICIDRPLMTPRQAAWLLEHEVRWAYV